MTQSFWGFSAEALKKYRTLIISLIFLIVLAVTSILISLYFSSLYNKSFSRYSALSQGIDLQHDFIIGLQGAADANHSPETRLHYANIAVTAYDELKNFYPVFLNGGQAYYGASKIEKTISIAPPIDELDNIQTADLYNKVLTNTLKPREKLIEKLRHAKTDSFEPNTNLDIELGTEVDSELINWGSGFIAFNNVRDDLKNRANHYNDINRKVLFTSILVLLGYFAIIALNNLRRLVKSDAQIAAARQETDDIMKNVGTGLFLLDKDLNIGNQYSTQLETIIGEAKVAGKNLSSLLHNKISGKDLETTQSFVNQLYNPRVKEKLVNDLNPLRKVMIKDSKHQSRFLDFKFSRVYRNKQIDKILVNVQDVTQQVRLEQRLEQERAQNDLQIEMLTTILNVNPTIINEFITNTQQNIVKINNILKSPGSQQFELQEKLAGMYRIMHSLKGEASTLKLHSFITIASNFEGILKDLQNKPKLAGNDFLPLTIHLEEMLSLSNTIESLGNRINQGVVGTKQNTTAPDMAIPQIKQVASSADNHHGTHATLETQAITSQANGANTVNSNGRNQLYQQFADSIALRQGKMVHLKASGFNELSLSRTLEEAIKEIVIQLIRNSVVHGIETPDIRLQYGKPEVGQIKATMIELTESYKITVEDDGQGIDYEAIRNKAIQMGYDATDIQDWDKNKLINLLFKSGFSTKDTADEDAGRGVGMDIIKARIKELHGHISIHTQAGQYTRFVIKLPKSLIE